MTNSDKMAAARAYLFSDHGKRAVQANMEKKRSAERAFDRIWEEVPHGDSLSSEAVVSIIAEVIGVAAGVKVGGIWTNLAHLEAQPVFMDAFELIARHGGRINYGLTPLQRNTLKVADKHAKQREKVAEATRSRINHP